jgi:hypothetical protein
MGVAVAHRRHPATAADPGGQAAPPLGERRLVVGVPRLVGRPRPVPHLDHVELLVLIHEDAARIRRVRVGRHADPADIAHLVQVPLDRIVPDAVPPLDHLSRSDAERQPVSGPGGDLLADDHEKVVSGERRPGGVRVGSVVLRDRDEVELRLPRRRCELFRRQFAGGRARRMHMAVTAVPAASPTRHPGRRRKRLRARRHIFHVHRRQITRDPASRRRNLLRQAFVLVRLATPARPADCPPKGRTGSVTWTRADGSMRGDLRRDKEPRT